METRTSPSVLQQFLIRFRVRHPWDMGHKRSDQIFVICPNKKNLARSFVTRVPRMPHAKSDQKLLQNWRTSLCFREFCLLIFGRFGFLRFGMTLLCVLSICSAPGQVNHDLWGATHHLGPIGCTWGTPEAPKIGPFGSLFWLFWVISLGMAILWVLSIFSVLRVRSH